MQCETCSKVLQQDDKLYVLWKWPETHNVIRLCLNCGAEACNKFIEDLEELKK
jgi:RNase P subunit RPR2